jgi:hypothetical protein
VTVAVSKTTLRMDAVAYVTPASESRDLGARRGPPSSVMDEGSGWVAAMGAPDGRGWRARRTSSWAAPDEGAPFGRRIDRRVGTRHRWRRGWKWP